MLRGKAVKTISEVKIHHVFNSALVSGPETLVLPNLRGFEPKPTIVLLQETRLTDGAASVKTYAEALGHEVFEIEVRSRFDLRAIGRLSAYWRSHPATIVHAHGVKASLYALLALRWSKARARLIVTHHGVRMNDTAGKLRLFEAIFEKLVIPRADQCLTVCTSDRDLLAARGLAREKLNVHLNGTDRELLPPNERVKRRSEIRRRWSEQLPGASIDEAFVIGIVGRLSQEKRHPLAFKALVDMRGMRPELKPLLLCFGSGPLEAELRETAHKLGIAECVNFLGYRPNVSAEMAGLDLLLSVSSAEGLPINLIEAGWAATPVLATAVDGVKDLIEDGRSGKLLAPDVSAEAVAHAILELSDRREEALRLGVGLQSRVRERFSSDSWRARLREIYAL